MRGGRSGRGEGGQTAVEVAAMLGLVALVVAVLASSGIASAVAGSVSSAVCSITSADCDEPEHVDAFIHRDPGGGPAFGTGPYPVPGIPWDGSVSYGERSTDEPGLYLDASISYDRSKCRIDADGNALVELGVTGTLRAGAMNEKEGKHIGASVDAYVGRDVGYKISTDPARADRIAAQQEKPPSPVDPTSIPEGTAITLDEATYAGLDLGLSYDALQAELGYSRGRKVSSAVQRTDDRHVRVTVGDADLVQSTLAVALGTDEANVSLSSEKSLADGKTRQVDIDISTAAGRRAYQSFVKTGRLPGNATTSKVVDYSGSTKLGGKLAGMEAKLIASDVTGQLVETTNPDGSTTITQFGRNNEVGFTHQFTIGAGGRPGRSTYTLRLQDVPASLAGALAKQAGGRADGQSKDVTLRFDDIDMRRMRSAAIDQLAMTNPRYSRDEIKDILAKDDPERYLGSPDPRVLTIAREDDPLEIAKLLATQAGGDSAAAADWLFQFGAGTAAARDHPGHVGDYAGDVAIDDPRFAKPAC